MLAKPMRIARWFNLLQAVIDLVTAGPATLAEGERAGAGVEPLEAIYLMIRGRSRSSPRFSPGGARSNSPAHRQGEDGLLHVEAILCLVVDPGELGVVT